MRPVNHIAHINNSSLIILFRNVLLLNSFKNIVKLKDFSRYTHTLNNTYKEAYLSGHHFLRSKMHQLIKLII